MRLSYEEIIKQAPQIETYINNIKPAPGDWHKYSQIKRDLYPLIPNGGFDAVIQEVVKRLQV